MFNLTKIVATIGPASEKLAFLQQAQGAGLAVLRLNFSHGDHEEQLVRIQHAHQINVARTFNLLGVMLDTKGPELRVGKFKDDGQLFERDQTVKVYTTAERYRKLLCDTGEVTLSHNVATYVLPGTVLLLDDGKLQLVVNKKLPDNTGFLATAQNKHFLATNKRVNIPGVDFKLPFLSTRDRKDIHFGLQHKVDFIALSFVSGSADVLAVRRILKNKKMTHVKLISKIENQLAIDNLDDIITASDGIMVARGDLGLEIPYAEVPY